MTSSVSPTPEPRAIEFGPCPEMEAWFRSHRRGYFGIDRVVFTEGSEFAVVESHYYHPTTGTAYFSPRRYEEPPWKVKLSPGERLALAERFGGAA